MNGNKARALRRVAETHTQGKDARITRKAYKIAKKNYKQFLKNGGKLNA